MFVRGLGIPFLFVFWVAPVVLGVIALVDAIRRPDSEWERASQNKTVWVVLIAVGFVACIFGVVIDLVYLLSIRPQLDQVSVPAGTVTAGATVIAQSPQPGWYRDPHGRHELRYFDGIRWCENVADGGVPGVDPTG